MGSIEISQGDVPPPDTIAVAPSWQGPGPAAYDLRTDTITTPTLSMLQAIAQSSLGDDVYQEDATTTAFEASMAALTGKPAAMLALSGTMGNQLALRSLLTQPPHAILCHHQSHILVAEAGGCATLSQAHMQAVRPRHGSGLYLTLEDVEREAVVSSNIHVAPTRVISLEVTLGGSITPLAEVRRIAAFARRHGIKMHLDGARIWEAVAAGAGSLPDYLECFDTAQMCFSKGLAAPMGSVIVGPAAVLDHCRWVRKSIGGGIRQAGIIAAAARVAVEENFLAGAGAKLRETHRKAKMVEQMWTRRGGTLVRPAETNMAVLDLVESGIEVADFVRVGAEEGLKLMGGRIVVHLQVVDEAFARLERVFDRVMAAKGKDVVAQQSVYGY
ncbi:uncharacterized protein L3040_001724 [Drepanopeziza brunnea f. sp. 'multigermtubi']|uniref:L-allo-threonine aldolase n=1 Tax=Marssonina brunnea f. sp. multigermtubi (strain MB_m1) TaxID=1072389 RepID=K1WSH7_MARBU|nr:l-allo-threonine aldolase [Drepanopeziza brunnea f. sp. 'multigermtubi' MB_m1]EKD15357.1 l-allo-threonine aldolase [Drepanopeziza brunnea f. sp. 'multigermtubi' MB_m1]KAJ5051963.1 hypothetical protein L3040_001724 [Drepanopeziza brunnea f. sp. 'multigermtubi']